MAGPPTPTYAGSRPVKSLAAGAGVSRALPAPWSDTHWRRRFGIYTGTGTAATGTASGLQYLDAVTAALGYRPRAVVGFSVIGGGKATWKTHVDNLFVTPGTHNSLRDVVVERGADVIMFSLQHLLHDPDTPVLAGDFLNITLDDWALTPTTRSGTVNGIPFTRVQRADAMLQLHDQIRAGRDDDLLAHLADTWIDHGYVDTEIDIRLMHEQNFHKRLFCAISPPERAGRLEQSYAELWRYIVDYLRSHVIFRLGYWPHKWKWVWNPGSLTFWLDRMPNCSWADWNEMWWPGDRYVDVVSFNMYPKTFWGRGWLEKLFADLECFGRQHRKPLAICEMGVEQATEGDEPEVWQRLYDEITRRSPATWHRLAAFGAVPGFDPLDATATPNAMARFTSLFGA